MNRSLTLVMVLSLCLPVVAASGERTQLIRRSIQAHEAQKHQVQQQLEESRTQVETTRQKARLLLDQLDQLELQIQQLRERLESLKRERTLVRREISEKQERLKEVGQELDKVQAFLARRLEVLYKFGKQAYLELMASAHDIGELQQRWTYLRAIAEQDNHFINVFKSQKAEMEELTQTLLSHEKRLNELVAEIDVQKVAVEEVKRQQVALLQDIRNQEETYLQYMEELAAVSRSLETKIHELQRQVEGESGIGTSERKGGFAGQKGALPYPVQGTVVSGFGLEHHEKFGTTIRHNGIDIATEQLSPVVAVYEGQVIYCDWVKGYGKVIIIDHGDKYYTLTAHLGEIAKQVGERVEGGEVIGSAGYAPGDGQKGIVYFEIRHRGNAVNPQSWLLQTLANSTKRGD